MDWPQRSLMDGCSGHNHPHPGENSRTPPPDRPMYMRLCCQIKELLTNGCRVDGLKKLLMYGCCLEWERGGHPLHRQNAVGGALIDRGWGPNIVEISSADPFSAERRGGGCRYTNRTSSPSPGTGGWPRPSILRSGGGALAHRHPVLLGDHRVSPGPQGTGGGHAGHGAAAAAVECSSA